MDIAYFILFLIIQLLQQVGEGEFLPWFSW